LRLPAPCCARASLTGKAPRYARGSVASLVPALRSAGQLAFLEQASETSVCVPRTQAAAMPAFLMNKAFLGASVGVQNGSKTVMASAAKVVKRAAKGAANKVGGLKQTAGYRRSQGAPLARAPEAGQGCSASRRGAGAAAVRKACRMCALSRLKSRVDGLSM